MVVRIIVLIVFEGWQVFNLAVIYPLYNPFTTGQNAVFSHVQLVQDFFYPKWSHEVLFLK